MSVDIANKRLSDLFVVMDRLTDLHRELLDSTRDKIEHMRNSDTDALRAGTEREGALVQAIGEQEGLRRQLMDAIGRGYGMNPEMARRMPARQLASRIDGPERDQLLETADRLRDVVQEVAELNRIAALIGQEVLRHVRSVFESVSTPDDPPETYSPSGWVKPSGTQRLFEMTG